MKKIATMLIGVEFNLGGDAPESKNNEKVIAPESKSNEKEIAPEVKDVIKIQEPATIPSSENLSKEAVVPVPVSLFEKLLELSKQAASQQTQASGADLATAIKQLADATREYPGGDDTRRFLGMKPIDEYSIDKDDVMPDNSFVLFFAHSTSYSIWDDVRNGSVIRTPYNRGFKFKTIQRTVDGSSPRNPNYISLSAIVIRSKKEAEWLRKHSLYGIKFFEQRDGNKDVSADEQDKLVKAYNIVSNMDDHSVMQRCIAYNIKIETQDVSVLRRNLAKKIAQGILADERKQRDSPIQSLNEFNKLNIK